MVKISGVNEARNFERPCSQFQLRERQREREQGWFIFTGDIHDEWLHSLYIDFDFRYGVGSTLRRYNIMTRLLL